jgi:excisionase family DNA binding protein
MTLDEVADLLQVSKPRLYRLIGERDRQRRLPAVKLHGKWFVERERIEEWLLKIWERNTDVEHAKGPRATPAQQLAALQTRNKHN